MSPEPVFRPRALEPAPAKAAPLDQRIRARLMDDDQLAQTVLVGRPLRPDEAASVAKQRGKRAAEDAANPRFGRLTPDVFDGLVDLTANGLHATHAAERPRSLESAARAALQRASKAVDDADKSARAKQRKQVLHDDEPADVELEGLDDDPYANVDIAEMSPEEFAAYLADDTNEQEEDY